MTRHPMLKPLVDIRARIYDMAHSPRRTTSTLRKHVRQKSKRATTPAGIVTIAKSASPHGGR